MKVKIISGILTFALMCSDALAQTDWVSRFLARYSQAQTAQVPGPNQSAAVSAATLAQPDAVALTTEDVIRLVLENNRDLTVSRVTPLSSLYSVASLLRPFQPNFHVIGTLNHTTTPSSNVLAGAVALVQLSHDYRVGIDQVLQTGTAYSVDFEFNRNSSNSVFFVYNPAYNGTIRYAITQHALRDFGRVANSRGIRIARNNEKVSELEFELQVIDLVTQSLQSYWDLVFGAADVTVKQRSLELASRTLRDNQIQVQIGSMAPIDLVQAEAEVATRTDDLVTAQYTIDRLQDEMKKLISGEIDPGFLLPRLNLIDPVRQPGAETILPLDKAIQFALENRRELKQADYDVANQDINVRYAKNQMLPVLDLTAGYAHAGLGGTQTIRTGLGQGAEVVRVVPGGVGDMFSQLFSYNFPAYNAGFTLQIPLGNRAGKADYDRALNERDLATMRKAATAQRIAVEVRNAYTALDMNRSRIATARRARELSNRRLDAEQQKFALGTSTVRFVLEEQRNVAQAETNEVQALIDYTKALVEYDRATGNTLTHNNIAIDKQHSNQLSLRN